MGHAKETELKDTEEKWVKLLKDNKVLKTQLEEATLESLRNFTKGSGWTTIAKRRRWYIADLHTFIESLLTSSSAEHIKNFHAQYHVYVPRLQEEIAKAREKEKDKTVGG